MKYFYLFFCWKKKKYFNKEFFFLEKKIYLFFLWRVILKIFFFFFFGGGGGVNIVLISSLKIGIPINKHGRLSIGPLLVILMNAHHVSYIIDNNYAFFSSWNRIKQEAAEPFCLTTGPSDVIRLVNRQIWKTFLCSCWVASLITTRWSG